MTAKPTRVEKILTPSVKRAIQSIAWVYLTDNFIVVGEKDFRKIEPEINCDFLAITPDNYFRVRDFRDEWRVREYREKVARGEIGFFAEHDGKTVGSIWATVNDTGESKVVRSYVKLLSNEALVHDIVTGEQFRGMGVGPFMVGSLTSFLLGRHGARKVIIDVNIRNSQSLRMMAKAGLKLNQRILSVSAFGKLVSQNVLRQYS